mmetsp:Transcript_20108/g.41306  ORF Transcript_20108/g.41306 Transcript_20108/m.41306 type:complete len:108 (+) Transcript_20108:28-351(+)
MLHETQSKKFHDRQHHSLLIEFHFTISYILLINHDVQENNTPCTRFRRCSFRIVVSRRVHTPDFIFDHFEPPNSTKVHHRGRYGRNPACLRDKRRIHCLSSKSGKAS